MAEDRVVKITNASGKDMPEHDAATCPKVSGCKDCSPPQWNGIGFPIKAGQTIVVKENVGNHLFLTHGGRIKITGGPYELTQIMQSPEGFFEMGPDGKFHALTIKADTSTKGGPQEGEGEDIAAVKRTGRFLAKGGDPL